MNENAMGTFGSVVWIAIVAAVTLALLAGSIREVVIASRTRARVADWLRAGIAREPGIVILKGRVWSDDQAPVAAVPVNITMSPNGIVEQTEEGPRTTRPFWLSTDQGDVAVDARPEVTLLIAPKIAGAPSGHVVRQIPVGADVEVYGRLGREHVPGVATDGFRDAAASWSLHGDETDMLRIAHCEEVTPGVELRRVYALGVLAATLGLAAGGQYAVAGAEADLLTGRGAHLVLGDTAPIFGLAFVVVILLAISTGARRWFFPYA